MLGKQGKGPPHWVCHRPGAVCESSVRTSSAATTAAKRVASWESREARLAEVPAVDTQKEEAPGILDEANNSFRLMDVKMCGRWPVNLAPNHWTASLGFWGIRNRGSNHWTASEGIDFKITAV